MSRLLPLLEVPRGASSAALVGTRFRLVRLLVLLVEDSVGLGFRDVFEFAVVSRSTWIGSWMLKLYTLSADQEPTNSVGLASENLHAVIWTLLLDVGNFPWGENRRTHYRCKLQLITRDDGRGT